MAKLTDIKFRIDQLDGGTFQTLCDVYLKCRGYGTGYSLGMSTGTSKTARGNPDTYFLAAGNKYVFAMYTTQKTDFLKKAFEDLQKCFDQNEQVSHLIMLLKLYIAIPMADCQPVKINCLEIFAKAKIRS